MMTKISEIHFSKYLLALALYLLFKIDMSAIFVHT